MSKNKFDFVILLNVLLVFSLMGSNRLDEPVILSIEPNSAPNDFDTSVVILGSGYVDSPTVYIGETLLEEITWVSEDQLDATVPWGLAPGDYTLSVENPDGSLASLPDAFTVEPGLNIWQSGEINGGRIPEIAVAYKDGNTRTMYVASRSVGLFRSRDDGVNWEYIYSGIGVRDLAVDPLDPDRIYMHGPWSLYRSEDEGDIWTALETNFPQQENAEESCAGHQKAYPHPTLSGVVFASNCSDPDGYVGLLKSINYGASWESSMTGITDPQISDLAYHPQNPSIMVVGTASGNVFISKNGGANWSFAGKPVDTVYKLVFDPWAPYDLWVGDYWGGEGGCGDLFSGIRYSVPPDYSSWNDIPGPNPREFCGHPEIHFSEDIEDRVYVANGNGYLSEDKGATWKLFGPGGLSFATELESIIGQPDKVFMTGRVFGLQCTSDHGDTWSLCNEGITAVASDKLAVSPAKPEVVYGMLSQTPGVYRGTQGGKTWAFMPAEGAMSVEAVEADSFIADRIYLGELGGIRISEDGGATWSERIQFPLPTKYSECRSFVETLRSHPNHEGTLLAAVRHWCADYQSSDGGIYRSLDYGETWSWMSVPAGTKYIQDIRFSPENTQLAFAVTSQDQILKSSDGGQTWTMIDHGIEPELCTYRLAVEPVSPFRVLIAGSCGEPSLLVSEDQGDTFEVIIPDPSPGINIQDIIFTPNEAILYAATPTGLMRSLNGGHSWYPVNGPMGVANIRSLDVVAVDELTILYVGTAGGTLATLETSRIQDAADRASGLIRAGVYRNSQPPWMDIFLPIFTK